MPQRWITLLIAAVLSSGPLRSAGAQSSIDLVITIASDGSGQDTMAVAYGKPLPETEIRQDFAALAREIGSGPPVVKIRPGADFTLAEARMSGLTNWSAGQVSLDALIHTYRRFGHFRVICLFAGNFPLRQAANLSRPPIRVETVATPSTVDYRVWVDQSGGVPNRVPPVGRSGGLSANVVVGVAAIALVVALCVFLLVHIILSQRRGSAEPRREK